MAQRRAPFPLSEFQCNIILTKIRNGQDSGLEQATLLASIYCDFLHALFMEPPLNKTPSQVEMDTGADEWVMTVHPDRLEQDFLYCTIMLQRYMPVLCQRVGQWFRDRGISADDDRITLYQYFLFRYSIATGEPEIEVKPVEDRLRRADEAFRKHDLANAESRRRLQ